MKKNAFIYIVPLQEDKSFDIWVANEAASKLLKPCLNEETLLQGYHLYNIRDFLEKECEFGSEFHPTSFGDIIEKRNLQLKISSYPISEKESFLEKLGGFLEKERKACEEVSITN